jgi:ADP-ribosylglycohydrolase
LVTASTRITHTDPRALQGALIIAEAAAYGSRVGGPDLDAQECLRILLPLATDPDLATRLRSAIEQAALGTSPQDFARSMGFERGVSGFMNHTVPTAIFCWLRHPTDFRAAVESAISLGGDSDTVGAITGALSGATLGPSAIPQSWLTGLLDWPWSITRMRHLAKQLSLAAEQHQPQRPNPAFWPAILLRNLGFTAIVIVHALRRLLPPY